MKNGTLCVVKDTTYVFSDPEMFERDLLGDLEQGNIAIFLGELRVAEFFQSGPVGKVIETNIVKVVMARVLTKFGVGWVRQNCLE